MKRFVRILSVFLAVAMSLQIAAFPVRAENVEEDDYTIENGVLTFKDGVVEIGGWHFVYFSKVANIIDVIIPDSVKIISNGAFYGCRNLKSVTIGSGVEFIGKSVFYGCRDMESMIVAENNPVYHTSDNCIIETGAKKLIYGCKTSVIPSDGSVTVIDEQAFFDCGCPVGLAIPETVTSIGKRAFYSCSFEDSLTIPSSVIEIDEEAFASSYIKSLTILDGVVSIGVAAFRSTRLESVVIPDSVKSIGRSAFGQCDYLKSIRIGSGTSSIETGAFYYCSSLKSIAVSPDNPYYHCSGNCLIETETKSLIVGCKTSVIPTDGSVTSIADWAFIRQMSMTAVSIPDSVVSIGDYAFAECNFLDTGLSDIKLGNGLEIIGEHAFEHCEHLKEIVLPESLRVIKGRAFQSCVALESLTIPRGVTEIGEGAFNWCNSLTLYVFKDSVAHEFAVANGIPYELIAEPQVQITGDIDADGEVTVGDALAVLRVAARLVEATPEVIAWGDIDNDGFVTVSDALIVLRIAAKLA